MNQYLFVIADPLTESYSVNKVVSSHLKKTLLANIEDIDCQTIDLYQQPPPYFDQASFQHLWLDDGQGSLDEDSVQYLQQQCRIVKEQRHLVISAPIWNNYLPAILKAWLDLIISPGYSYDFTAEGIRPLHRLQSVTVVLSAGGNLSRNDMDQAILQLLKATFRYIQVEDFHSLVVDRQEPSLYPEHEQIKEQSMLRAEQLVSQYFLPDST